MDKIRPGNIAKGFGKAIKTAITKKEAEFVTKRKAHCFAPCEHKTKAPDAAAMCKICGCFLLEKTQVEETYCPINKWDDIKILENVGVAVRNLSTDKVKLEVTSDRQVSLTYIDPVRKNSDTRVEVEFINDRANFDLKNENLTGLRITTSCGCTSSTKAPQKLADGMSFNATFSYKWKSSRVGKDFAQTIRLSTDQGNIFIRLKGHVL